MNPTRTLKPLIVALVALVDLRASLAVADAPSPVASSVVADAPPEPLPGASEHGLVLDATLAGGSTSLVPQLGSLPLLTAGASLRYRRGLAEVGAEFEVGAAGFDYTTFSGGLLGGLRYDPLRWLRLEALLEVGGDYVDNVSTGLFATGSGNDSALLPYVGGQLGLSLVGTGHAVLGLWASARDSMAQATIVPTIETQSLFGGGTTTTTPYTIGGPTFTVGIRFGYDWEL